MKLLLVTILIFFALICCQQKNATTIKESNNSAVKLKSNIENQKNQIANNQNCIYGNISMNLGKGLIIAPDTFEIFHDSLLNVKYSTIDMYNDFDKINICSFFFKPDYGIMHFSCLSETNMSYKVLTGDAEYKYLPKTKKYKFCTWGDYILTSFGIRRLTEDSGKLASKEPLRLKPTENSKTLVIPSGHEMFCPIEIKGDWVKVKYDCFYNQDNNLFEGQPCNSYINKCPNPLTGWLKWRSGNKLLIDIFIML